MEDLGKRVAAIEKEIELLALRRSNLTSYTIGFHGEVDVTNKRLDRIERILERTEKIVKSNARAIQVLAQQTDK